MVCLVTIVLKGFRLLHISRKTNKKGIHSNLMKTAQKMCTMGFTMTMKPKLKRMKLSTTKKALVFDAMIVGSPMAVSFT